MNLIHIAGYLGADPEVRVTSTGQKVTTLRVASRVRRGNQEDTIWWRVTIWGEQYDKMISYLKKGSAVIVIGEMQKPEIFKDREGNPQVSMNITAIHIMFSPFGKGSEKSVAETSQANVETPPKEEVAFASFSSGTQPVDKNKADLDDEIPF